MKKYLKNEMGYFVSESSVQVLGFLAVVAMLALLWVHVHDNKVGQENYQVVISEMSKGKDKIVVDKEHTKNLSDLQTLAVTQNYTITVMSDQTLLLEKKNK